MNDDGYIDEHLARRLVQAQFPELDPVRVERLGEGCDSVAFEVNRTWVFKFPKRADVERQLPIEAKLLRWLGLRGSPVPVPAFVFEGRPSEEFPRHFGGYAKLTGLPANRLDGPAADPEGLAPVLGRFLSWLHALPMDDALALGVPDERHDAVMMDVQKEALEEFPVLWRVTGDAPFDAWRAFFEDVRSVPRATASAFAVVHNDLAAEHVLMGERGARVTGVIDWSDAAIGDRAIDLAGIVHWGGAAFLNGVLAHYAGDVDEGLLARARFLAAGRGVLDVKFGLERGDRAYVEGGLRAIATAIGR
jgi:aminoglycoside phosphotransferase (APT) family kinase protein